MFKKILIANRGEIACRIQQTAHQLGIKTVAVYSDVDCDALHVKMADQAVHIGAAPAAESYLQADRIIQAAIDTGAQAVHPGYGFLSENPEFAEKLAKAGIVFVGPTADAIRKMGLKDQAKRLMQEAGVPVVPGYHGESQDRDVLAKEAEKIGYPVLIKARAGGGGKGMRLVENSRDFFDALESATREGLTSFGDGHVLIEKFICTPRHIEVQVFGDNLGNVVHLFERDCSMQRRHQKVIEEAPAPGMTADVRAAMTDAATRAAREINYQGAGTIEFIVDGTGPLRKDGFWFMEMNTRLQVEHPVTEAITGLDLVEWQLRVAAGQRLPLLQDEISMDGHAFEARIYAENPQNDFLPAPGQLKLLNLSETCRIDTGVESGDSVSPFYDPMIAKLTSHGGTRDVALGLLQRGLDDSICIGTATNMSFLSRLSSDEDFAAENLDTGLIERKQERLTAQSEHSKFAVLAAYLIAHNVILDTQRLGWRQWSADQCPVHLTINGQKLDTQIRIEGDGVISMIDQDTRHQFNQVKIIENTVFAWDNGKKLTAGSAQFSDHISVKIDGEQFDFKRHDPLDVTKTGFANTDHVLSPMTGIISTIYVSKGDQVAMGDRLMVIEAMKMEHTIKAHRGGMIADITYAVSDAVDESALLVTFENEAE